MAATVARTSRLIHHIPAVQHPTHARGHATPDITAAVPPDIHPVQIVAVVIIVPAERIAQHAHPRFRPVHQHQEILLVCLMAVGVIMNTGPVQMTVFAIGISAMKQEFSI